VADVQEQYANFQNEALFDIGIRDVRGNSTGFKNIQGQPDLDKDKDIKLIPA